MKNLVLNLGLAACLLSACAAPYRLVYSSGFSFARYDYLIVAKPDSSGIATSLYGVDIEFANLMASYNFKIVGDKEFVTLPPEQRARTLFARMAVSASKDEILISVSFDDALSGRTQASVTAREDGDIFDAGDRQDAFEEVSRTLTKAIVQDKGLTVTSGSGSNPIAAAP